MTRHPDMPQQLDPPSRAMVLQIARDSLDACARGASPPPLIESTMPSALSEKRGVFVTLRSRGDLRGCIGVLGEDHTLARNVRQSTIRSATRDPRFDPVSADELESIRIEVSVLGTGDAPGSPWIAIRGPEEIVIGRDGVRLVAPGGRTAVLLPQVATERGWGVAELLDALVNKAGLPADALHQPGLRLHRFTAEVFSES